MLQLTVYSLTGKEECGGFSDTGRGDLLEKKLSAVLFSMDSKTTLTRVSHLFLCALEWMITFMKVVA